MPQLLLELFSEEIPARMQGQAARDLERMAAERLKAAGLAYEGLRAFAGPRRLTLVADGLPSAQADRVEARKGPRANAPEQALQGFLRSTGLTREQLTVRDGVYFAHIDKPGRQTPEIVAEMVEEIVRSFPWPKSMRWGEGALRWVRPLKRIVCLFDGRVAPFAIEGVESGDITEGHRFMGIGPAPFSIGDFEDYRRKLLDRFVVLEADERKRRIAIGARAACAAKGLELVEDEGLLEEVAGLAEWPTPILGEMDPGFLDLPPEVIRTSMRTHQKYFAVRAPEADGLAPHFVVVANIEARDGGRMLAAGNAKVLSARLSDARFFWDEDRRPGAFERWREKLNGVTFHAKLGTLAERVERITALAREIAPLVGADPELAAEAARLAKADLASGMVAEFPELQGIMGGYYAREVLRRPGGSGVSPLILEQALQDGEEDPLSGVDQMLQATQGFTPDQADQIADAIRDHYKPLGPTDSVPTAPVSVVVALADKLDTLAGFFAIDETPTGSKDPYALRRAALGVIRLLLENDARVRLSKLIRTADFIRAEQPAGALGKSGQQLTPDLLAFFADRLKVLLREEGKRHDLVDAVFALGDDDLVRIVARVEALDAFLKTEDGANLLAGYRRAVNILKAEAKKNPQGAALYEPFSLDGGRAGMGVTPAAEAGATVALSGEGSTPNPAPSPIQGEGKTEDAATPPEERALRTALDQVLAELEPKLKLEDFTGAMASLARLRAPVDAFFDRVLVNAPDPEVRLNRLRLLASIRDAAGRVADFSLIAG